MPHRNQKIFDQGWMSWGSGMRYLDNPHPLASDEYGAWSDGWQAAEEDYRHQQSERDEYGDRADYEYDRNR
jgi:hypothetical protein